MRLGQLLLTLAFSFLVRSFDMRDHAPPLCLLAVGQRVLASRIWIFATLELEPDGCAFQFQCLQESILEKTSVRIGHGLRLVTMDHDQRRIGSAGMRITKFNAPAMYQRRRVI